MFLVVLLLGSGAKLFLVCMRGLLCFYQIYTVHEFSRPGVCAAENSMRQLLARPTTEECDLDELSPSVIWWTVWI